MIQSVYILYTENTQADVSPSQLNFLHMSPSGYARWERGKQTSQINENVSEIASVPAKSLLGFISPQAGIVDATWRDSGRICYENEMLTCLQGWTGVWWLAADGAAAYSPLPTFRLDREAHGGRQID